MALSPPTSELMKAAIAGDIGYVQELPEEELRAGIAKRDEDGR